MKVVTDVKKIKKAAKKAGIIVARTNGSHEIWNDLNGKTWPFAAHKKEASSKVAKEAWAFIAGDYAQAYTNNNYV